MQSHSLKFYLYTITPIHHLSITPFNAIHDYSSSEILHHTKLYQKGR